MCDYDGSSYEQISDHEVARTRKVHECSSCLKPIPAGSRARRWVGKSDGDLCSGYCCVACDWSHRQQDHSALHLCYGWAWNSDEALFDEQRYQYIASALARGVEPTLLGVIAEIRCHLVAEAGDDVEARAEAEAWTWPAMSEAGT